MPRIQPIQGSSVCSNSTNGVGELPRGQETQRPKRNSAAGLDIASQVEAPRPAGRLDELGAAAAKLTVEMAPWHGAAPIVSKPGDEKPLPTSAIVASVYDGDTLVLKDRDIHVRVQNVNTPELKPLEPFGPEAGELTRKLLVGKKVQLDFDAGRAKDHYGRVIARVRLPDGSDLAEKLIEEGLGQLFVVSEKGNPGDLERLLAAQEKAKAAKLGIWATERFQGDFSISSFHANGYGNDHEDPNGEYCRMVNITGRPLELSDYVISNKGGQSFALPPATVKPGHTVQIFSGTGTNLTDPTSAIRVFLGANAPIWDNFDERLAVTDAKHHVVASREHTAKQRDINTLRDPVTQTTVNGLGLDMRAEYATPAKLPVKGKLLVDDGDTVFIPSPREGVFTVAISDDDTGRQVTRRVRIADQKESPPGMLSIRLMGVDTPETHYEVPTDDGKSVFYSQGRAGELAAERLFALLENADAVSVVPNPKRPFDTYSRLLGTVEAHLKDGSTVKVNEWLVEQGLGEMAVYYTGKEFDLAGFARFRKAAKKAVDAKRGIYSNGDGRCEERPVDFRRRLRAAGTAPAFVIDIEKRVIYSSRDIDKIAPYNRLFCFQPRIKEAVRELGLTVGEGVPV